ncbi:50S ribosomal protein L35 [Candidatus Legionella polyplacis]|uniref:Large ribosomal subunit protein bL35 n=1 Tax=Candidatus Legionella polyplacis TaxID=2005262 RepID=A0ABZ2GWW3_9GAMM
MIKLKSHRGIKKRFKILGNGLIKYRHSNRNHILTKKSSKRKRSLRVSSKFLKKCDTYSILKLYKFGG